MRYFEHDELRLAYDVVGEAKIVAPTLIVAGELEDQGCAEAAARIPQGRAVILPGLGHIGAFAQSSAVLPHALAFLHETLER